MTPNALAVLPDGYVRLFQRARARLEPDEAVRAMWLGGSLARGTADAASDLDLLVAVTDAELDDFASAWRRWLADITPTVLAEKLPFAKGSFYSVTPGFERLDMVVEPVSSLDTTFFRWRETVFDKDGLSARVPAPDGDADVSQHRVAALVTEYFRASAVETILVRDDWLLAREHLHFVGSLIYGLFVESNAPLPPMGVKQWKAKLTEPQQRVLGELPVAVSCIEELRRAHLELAAVFVTNAEALCARLGVSWPERLEVAAADHLRQRLDLDEPHPRRGPVVV